MCKKSGALRLILDGRIPSQLFDEPPKDKLATGAAFALARPPPPQWPAARRPSSTSSCCPMAHVTAAMLKTCIPPLVVPRR